MKPANCIIEDKRTVRIMSRELRWFFEMNFEQFQLKMYLKVIVWIKSHVYTYGKKTTTTDVWQQWFQRNENDKNNSTQNRSHLEQQTPCWIYSLTCLLYLRSCNWRHSWRNTFSSFFLSRKACLATLQLFLNVFNRTILCLGHVHPREEDEECQTARENQKCILFCDLL